MDTEGYPTEEELEIVKNWEFSKDFYGEIPKFLEFVKDNWWMPDWGWNEKQEEEDGETVTNLYLSTGGWSGNEEMIAAMRNTWFWMHCWKQHKRGGHYVFELKTKPIK